MKGENNDPGLSRIHGLKQAIAEFGNLFREIPKPDIEYANYRTVQCNPPRLRGEGVTDPAVAQGPAQLDPVNSR